MKPSAPPLLIATIITAISLAAAIAGLAYGNLLLSGIALGGGAGGVSVAIRHVNRKRS